MQSDRRPERGRAPVRPGDGPRRASDGPRRASAAPRWIRRAAAVWGLLGAATLSAAAEALIDSLVVTQRAVSWSLEIPFTGEWYHEAAENPPRVVIDLIHARSRLPLAPGVYTLALDEGPVTELRVSQYDNDPARPVVRLTLLLREPLAYHAGRHTGGSRLAFARPAGASWGAPRRQVISRASAPQREAAESHARIEETAPPAPFAEPAEFAEAGEPLAEPEEPLAVPVEPAPLVEGERSPARIEETETPAMLAEPEERAEAAASPARVIAPPVAAALPDEVEALLTDSTFFVSERRAAADGSASAAARALGEAQASVLTGDTSAALDALTRCEQFYSESEAAGQARLLRRLLLRQAGRVVEADLGPPPPAEGPWPLLRSDVFAALFRAARAGGDLAVSDEVLTAWRAAEPAASDWSAAALELAELYGDLSRAAEAVRWARLALAARPDLRARPRALLLLGGALLESGDPAAAAAWLEEAARGDDPRVRARAQALQADLFFRQGRFAEAAATYEVLSGETVARVERDWARYQLGNCLRATGEWARAAEALSAVAADAGNVWAASARVRVLDLMEVKGASAD